MKKRRLKLALINMPFAKVTAPSLALAQLETVLKSRFKNRLQVDIHYLNMDFASYIGDFSVYNHPYSSYGSMTHASDWFFRQAAFPDAPDNSREYFSRYYFAKDPETRRLRKFLLEKRKGVETVLNGYIDKCHLLDADIVGFTLLFSETVASLAMARLLKKRKPGIVTIIGGASCDGETAQVYAERIAQIDYVFSGPALVSLPEFIKHRLSGETGKCDHINGVLSKTNKARWTEPLNCGSEPARTATGQILTTGDELDINRNIIPDHTAFLDTFDANFPDGRIKPMLIFETSRGCRWGEHLRCSFCGLNGPMTRYRTLTPANAIKQIKALHRYVPRVFFFLAADNMMPENYPADVFAKFPPTDKMQIGYEARPNLSEKEIGILCRAGVRRIQPGIEALSTSSLKLMRKGSTAFRNLQFLKDSARHPFILDWNLLVYSPGEKEEVYEKYMHYIPLMHHFPPPIAVIPVMFVKNSHYFEHAKEYGLDLRPQDYYRLIFPFDAVDIRRMAYRFTDNNAHLERMHYWLERLNKAASSWRARWFNRDAKTPSRLCFLENVTKPALYDSRTGHAVEYQISPLTKSLIDYLERPATRDMISTQFLNTPGFNIDREIKFLLKRNLLFEENGRFMSLVTG